MDDQTDALVGTWQLERIERGTRVVPGGLEQLVVRPTCLSELPAQREPPPEHTYVAYVQGDGSVLLEIDHMRRGHLFVLACVAERELRLRWGAPDGERPASMEQGGDLEVYSRIAIAPKEEPEVAKEIDAPFGKLRFDRGAGVWRCRGIVPAGGHRCDLEIEVNDDPADALALAEKALTTARAVPLDRIAEEAVDSLFALARDLAGQAFGLEQTAYRLSRLLEGFDDRERPLDDDDPRRTAPPALTPAAVRVGAEGVRVRFAEGIEIELDGRHAIVDVFYVDAAR